MIHYDVLPYPMRNSSISLKVWHLLFSSIFCRWLFLSYRQIRHPLNYFLPLCFWPFRALGKNLCAIILFFLVKCPRQCCCHWYGCNIHSDRLEVGLCHLYFVSPRERSWRQHWIRSRLMSCILCLTSKTAKTSAGILEEGACYCAQNLELSQTFGNVVFTVPTYSM